MDNRIPGGEVWNMELPVFPAIESAEGPRVQIEGKSYDWFRGSGYLGLYGHPEILQAACDATLRYGMKLRAKRKIGCHPCLLELEKNACRFFETESVAYFNSGYSGNAVLLAALEGRFDKVFVDRFAHHSIIDAVKGCGLPALFFAHRDPEALEQLLNKYLNPGEKPLVISDGIFPATGEIAPLDEYRKILGKYDNALLCLDDAHGAGVLGNTGKGTFEYFNLDGNPDGPELYSCTTMSKAFGAYGGIIAGNQKIVEKINLLSGVCLGASPPPPGVTAASARAFEIVLREPGIRERLAANVSHVRRGLAAIGFETDIDSPTPVICLEYRKYPGLKILPRIFFEEENIAVLEMTGGYPGIPAGGALALTVFAGHTDEQIKGLLDAFQRHY